MYVTNQHSPFDNPFDLSSVPVAGGKEVAILWVDHYWDGPLEGVCELRGERLWFQYYYDPWIDGNDETNLPTDDDARLAELALGDPPLRVLLLHRITEEQMQEERRWQTLFVQHVGAHFDTSGEFREADFQEYSPKLFYETYQRARPTLDLADAPVVAVCVL